MRQLTKTALCLIIFGMTSIASAEEPCWSFGFASEGDLCWLMNEDMPSKVLLGEVKLPKKIGEPAKCYSENPIKKSTTTGTTFAFLSGDYKKLQRGIPGREPIPAPQFVGQFPYCHPDIKEAKEHPLGEVRQRGGAQNVICVSQRNDETNSRIEFGLWDNEASVCKSIGVVYSSNGSRKNEKYRPVCLYQLLEQKKGWAINGPSGKTKFDTSGKNWYQGMHECIERQRNERDEMPYCSWDREGHFMYGRSQNPNDGGDEENAIVMYRCLYELIED